MPEPSFNQRAWGSSRGKRVFQQLKDFGVHGSYELDDDHNGRGALFVELHLVDAENTWALKQYVGELMKLFGQDEGLEMFGKAEMRFYAGGEGAAVAPGGETHQKQRRKEKERTQIVSEKAATKAQGRTRKPAR